MTRIAIHTMVIVAALLSFGCTTFTNYPVIYDTKGPWADTVLTGQYEQAYVFPPYFQAARIWPDGTDELFNTVAQNAMGDQWIYIYNNYDPSGEVKWLDKTYCDPARAAGCAIVTAWNPDLPEDDPWDAELDRSCSGFRSLNTFLSLTARSRECGSGIMADPQAAAYEFSLLERRNYRGLSVYHLPVDSSVATFTLHSLESGVTQEVPLYGRTSLYLDDDLRMIVPYAANREYQDRFLRRFAESYGRVVELEVTYGSLKTRVDMKLLH